MPNRNYYLKSNPNEDAYFDINHVQSLIDSEQYQEAADYYKQFEYTNALTRSKANAKVRELESLSRSNIALKKNLGESDYSIVRFANNCLSIGSYDGIRYAKNAAGQPIYKDDDDFAQKNPDFAAFNKAYRELGSTKEWVNKTIGYTSRGRAITEGYWESKDDAVTLKATLPYVKTGVFGDFSVRDNNDEADVIANYTKLTGKNRNDLINDGVIITTEDNGDVSFIYDKTNPSAIPLTLAINNVSNNYSFDENRARIVGYDKEGNEIKEAVYGRSYMGPDETTGANNNAHNIVIMGRLYNDAVNRSKELLSPNNEELNKVYSSTSFNIPGLLKKEHKELVIENVKSMAFADYEHYGYLDSDDGETLKLFDENDFREFRRNMNGRSTNQIHFQGMTVNGVTGILITLDPKLDNEGNPKDDDSEMKMFIPNYLNMITEYSINNSTDLQAQMELNNMEDYGSSYQYIFDDGSRGYIDDAGQVRRVNINGETYLDDSPEAKQTLLRDIDRDFIVKQADDRMSYHMNNKGEYNMKMVRSDAAKIAYAAGEELYPGIPLKTIDGKDITIDDIFADNSKFMQNIENTCNSYTIEKVQDIFEIYNAIVGKTINKK